MKGRGRQLTGTIALIAPLAFLCVVGGVTWVAVAQPVPEIEPSWTPPSPASAPERVDERERMVRTQMEDVDDLRLPVRDPDVLRAMRTVPRHVFVPSEHRDKAVRPATTALCVESSRRA